MTNVIHKYRQDKTYDKDVKMQMRLKFVFKHFLWFTKKKVLSNIASAAFRGKAVIF